MKHLWVALCVLLGACGPAAAVNIADAPYNAVGDNSTDNTSGIQSALNANSGEVYVPQGVFCSRSLTVQSNTKVHGPGTLKACGSINAYGTFLTATGSDIEISVKKIDVDQSTYGTVNTIAFNGATRAKVDGVHFTKSGRWAVFILGGCTDCGVENSTIENFAQSAVANGFGTPNVRTLIRDNLVLSPGNNNGQALGSATANVDTDIVGNRVYANGVQVFAIYVNPSEVGPRVTGNRIYDSGVEAIAGHGVVTDNVAMWPSSASHDFGMSFTPAGGANLPFTYAARNLIVKPGKACMDFGGYTTAQMIVEDNTCVDPNQLEVTDGSGAGISLGYHGVQNAIIRKNTIVSNDGKMTWGIYETEQSAGITDYNEFESNKIRGGINGSYRIIGAHSVAN